MGSVQNDFSDILADAKGAAEVQVKAALRQQNKLEWQCDLTIVGNPGMSAGITFIIEGFGVYDGKYIADVVTHSLGDSYTTQIKGHRCLEGY